MSKRFTDTGKWDHRWFMGLNQQMKLFWLFILDKCDHAGIWNVNQMLASVYIGSEINLNAVLNVFENRIIPISENRWFVPKFIKYQYGELNSAVKPHQSVIKILGTYNLLEEYENLLNNPPNEVEKDRQSPNPSLTACKELKKGYPGVHSTTKDKEKDKAKDKVKAKVKDKAKDKIVARDSMPAPKEIVKLYNSICSNFPQCKLLNQKRIGHINEANKSELFNNASDWQMYFQKANKIPFLSGDNNRNWKADFEWLVNKNNALKVAEGRYDKLGHVGKGEKAIKNIKKLLDQNPYKKTKNSRPETKNGGQL